MKLDFSKVEARTCGKADAKAHFEAVQGSFEEVHKFIPWVEPMHYWTIEDHEIFLERAKADTRTWKNYLFFYEDKVIGAGHLKPTIWNNSAEISYWVRSGYEGSGLGSYIAKTMARFAFSNLGSLFVVIQTDRNNIGSRKIAERMGATCQLIYGYIDHLGDLCNMLVWALPSPYAKLAARFDSRYTFNPIANVPDLYYRTDSQHMIDRYMTPDEGLSKS